VVPLSFAARPTSRDAHAAGGSEVPGCSERRSHKAQHWPEEDMMKRYTHSVSIYTAQKKIKGTPKQHNVTPSTSHFCGINLSSQEATLMVNQFHLLLCKWNRHQVGMRGTDNPHKGVVLQVVPTDRFSVLILSGWCFGHFCILSELSPLEVAWGGVYNPMA